MLVQLEEEEEKHERRGLDEDSLRWLLMESVKAGTMAFFWCLKSQIVRLKAKAFYKWQQKAALQSFLAPYKETARINSNYDKDGRFGRDHTEHIVTNSIARSERKLILSLRRDYIRGEKDWLTPRSKAMSSKYHNFFASDYNANSGSKPTTQQSLQHNGDFDTYKSSHNSSRHLHSHEDKELPSYMRPTTSAAGKYSKNEVDDYKKITKVVRDYSPVKQVDTSRRSSSHSRDNISRNSSPEKVKKRSLSVDELNKSTSLSRQHEHTHSNYNGALHSSSPRRDQVTEVDEGEAPQRGRSREVKPATAGSYNGSPRGSNHIGRPLRPAPLNIPKTENSYPLKAAHMSARSTRPLPIEDDGISKESLLNTLNERFKALAAKGLLDESTIRSVLQNNADIVDDYWNKSYEGVEGGRSSHANAKKPSSSRNGALHSARSSEVKAAVGNDAHSLFTESTDGEKYTKKGIIKKHDSHEADFRSHTHHRHEVEARGPPVAAVEKQPEKYDRSREEYSSPSRRRTKSVDTSSTRGRSQYPSAKNNLNSSQRKSSWRYGKSLSPSPSKTSLVVSPPASNNTIFVDKAQLRLLQPKGRIEENEKSKPWFASLRS